MQLSLKRVGDYSVRAMIHVARRADGELSQARQIAAEMQIPYKVLTQVMPNLVAAGLVEATAGPSGGYQLACPPADISLLEVVEAAEGPATFSHCVLRDGPCDWETTCPVHDTWSRAQASLERELASTTMADLALIDAEIQTGVHEPEFPPHAEPTERGGLRG